MKSKASSRQNAPLARRIPRWLIPGSVMLIVLAGLTWAVPWFTPGPDVGHLLETLEGGGGSRWRAAANLAAALSDPHNDAQRRDPATARRLIALAQRETQLAAPDENQAGLEVCLCLLLGELQTPEPLELLTELAAGGGRAARNDVRLAAMQSIAVLAGRLGSEVVVRQPRLVDTLLETSRADDPRLRGTAAFVLGVLGGPLTAPRLNQLLADPAPEVRDNAAVALARQGDAACAGVLVEMLSAADMRAERHTEAASGTPPGKPAAQPPGRDLQRMHRQMVVINALRAADKLAQGNHTADLGRLEEAIRQIYVADIDAATAVEATAVLHRLRDRHLPAAAATPRAEK